MGEGEQRGCVSVSGGGPGIDVGVGCEGIG